MKNFEILVALIIASIFFSSCSAKIFYSPDAYSLAYEHEIISIIPPSVSIEASKNVEANAMVEQQNTESVNFQKAMYSFMLDRKMNGKFYQEIQDIEDTMIKLKRMGYPERQLTTSELCDELDVDALLISNYSLSKPMSKGAAIASLFLFGGSGATNEVIATLSLKDCKKNKLIWNYEEELSGGLGSSSGKLVKNLMKCASDKMPYN